ncbi:hypothetical protein RHGRI_015479 [Rhododendron griersonianum]|uniref:NADP-dependent oxidoreductase domain-containing protein n=1 Tax=Rhododendron griersonianum TaxID=479676 RepID=A0AAV6KDN0_9ERIC|nr:hypothetical protein RHGRI_015479 [Rhododendron griersonianum]
MVSIPEIQIPLSELGSTPNANTHCTSIPLLGYGTASWPFGEPEEIIKGSILTAIKLGYRHFDTASVYLSEQCLGEAISRALELGLIESRGELFVTSKLWCSDVHPHRVLPVLQDTLQKLGLEYLDLYLIHFPVSMNSPGSYVVPFNQSDLLPMDFKSVWEAMEECHKLGLTKNIGVSNFSVKKLQQLLLTAKIPPAVNQVEISPLWQQKKLRKFCEEKGIHVTAYSSLGLLEMGLRAGSEHTGKELQRGEDERKSRHIRLEAKLRRVSKDRHIRRIVDSSSYPMLALSNLLRSSGMGKFECYIESIDNE